MASGVISNFNSSDLIVGSSNDVQNVIVSVDVAGDFYVDADKNSFAKAGYSIEGLMAFSGTYRMFIRGIGSDRIYYTVAVANPGQSSSISVIPLYKKI